MLGKWRQIPKKTTLSGWVLLEVVISMVMIAFLIESSRSLTFDSTKKVRALVQEHQASGEAMFHSNYVQITGGTLPSYEVKGGEEGVPLSYPSCTLCQGKQLLQWAKEASAL